MPRASAASAKRLLLGSDPIRRSVYIVGLDAGGLDVLPGPHRSAGRRSAECSGADARLVGAALPRF